MVSGVQPIICMAVVLNTTCTLPCTSLSQQRVPGERSRLTARSSRALHTDNLAPSLTGLRRQHCGRAGRLDDIANANRRLHVCRRWPRRDQCGHAARYGGDARIAHCASARGRPAYVRYFPYTETMLACTASSAASDE